MARHLCPQALTQLPLSALESALFSLVIYFMVNFYRWVGVGL